MTRRRFTRVAIVAVGALPLLAACGGQIREPAATVEGSDITFAQVEDQFDTFGVPDDQVTSTSVWASVLNDMIRSRLIADEIDRRGVEVTDDDLADAAEALASIETEDPELFAELQPQQAELIALSYALVGGRPDSSAVEEYIAENRDRLVCANVVATIDRATADNARVALIGGQSAASLVAANPTSMQQSVGCGLVGDGSIPEEFESQLTALNVGDVSEVVELAQQNQQTGATQTSYTVLVKVAPTAANAAGVVRSDAIASATAALQAFLAEAGEDGAVKVSSRIGRWGADEEGVLYGEGSYGVIPNVAPVVRAEPTPATTAPNPLLLEQP